MISELFSLKHELITKVESLLASKKYSIVFHASGLPNDIEEIVIKFQDYNIQKNEKKYKLFYFGNKLPNIFIKLVDISELDVFLNTWTSSVPEIREILIFNSNRSLEEFREFNSTDFLYDKFKNDLYAVVVNSQSDNTNKIFELIVIE